MNSNKMSLKEILTTLSNEKLFSLEKMDAAAAALATPEEKSNPWYLKVLITISAWISALLLIVGMALTLDFSEEAFLVMGFIYVVGAVFIRSNSGKSDFGKQVALALSITGQIMFIFGFVETFHIRTESFIYMIFILLQIILIATYPDWLHRFLSTLGIITAIAIWIFEEFPKTDILIFYAIFLAIVTVVVWENESYWSESKLSAVVIPPVAYGMALGAMGLAAPMVGELLTEEISPKMWWLLPIGLGIVLLLQERQIFIKYNLRMTSPLGFVAVGATILLAMVTAHTPGLLVSVTIILLGFQRSSTSLRMLATAFFGWFIIFYYYNLDLTLLIKSLVLIGSGFLLFALRLALRMQTGAKLEVSK